MMEEEFHADKITMREPRQRFPTLVTTVSSLSDSFQEVVEPYFSPESHIVRIPIGYYPFRRLRGKISLPFAWRKTPERILVFEPDVITILESDPIGHVTKTSVPWGALLKIHVFVMLLYSSIELVWIDRDHLETREIEYNTVGEVPLLRGLDLLRAGYPPCLPPAPLEDREAILAPLPLKYRNYLRDSVLCDEQLYTAIFQPAIRLGAGLLHTKHTPNRAIGITERHLLIVDDRHGRFSPELGYSTYRCLYPLVQIQDMAVETAQDVCWLKLHHGCGSVTQPTEIALEPAKVEALWPVLQAHTLYVTGSAQA